MNRDRTAHRESEIKEIIRIVQEHEFTEHETKLVKQSLAKVATSSIAAGAVNGYLWWRLLKRVPTLTKIGIVVAQVNMGALAGGLGGLYWITSVSKDITHLRETALGTKLSDWWKKYGGKRAE